MDVLKKMAWQTPRNMSPNTIQSYRDALKLFLRFAVDTATVQDLLYVQNTLNARTS